MLYHRMLLTAVLGFLVSLAVAVPVALAEPPPHAPAHGWRKKHDPYYVGYTGHRWKDDYGIRGGHCDRSRVGTVLGAVAGGAIGAAVSDRDDRLIAVLAGAAIGAIIGKEIGEDMDRDDRACFGHSLELLPDGRQVRWDGSRRGMYYALTPNRRFERDGLVCRRFTLVRHFAGGIITRTGNACRYSDDEWRMVGG